MSKNPHLDPDSDSDPNTQEMSYFNLSKNTVWIEVTRASYAVGIGGVVMMILVFGTYTLGIESQGVVAATILSIGLLLPVVLFMYDRHNQYDLVIADVAVTYLVRPVSLLYRIFNPDFGK
jgi:hypothetical protein